MVDGVGQCMGEGSHHGKNLRRNSICPALPPFNVKRLLGHAPWRNGQSDVTQPQLWSELGICKKVDARFWFGGVPREQKMLKGHLPRVIYHRVYSNIRR